eukprot:1152974-Pelagomonas_calceolata.AAC.5
MKPAWLAKRELGTKGKDKLRTQRTLLLHQAYKTGFVRIAGLAVWILLLSVSATLFYGYIFKFKKLS